MTISKDKQYRTRDGREVEIYRTDGGGVRPVLGACKLIEYNQWVLCNWLENGRLGIDDTCWDLIEVKPRFRIERWVNVYPDDLCVQFKSRTTALLSRQSDCLSTKRIIIEGTEGEDDA